MNRAVWFNMNSRPFFRDRLFTAVIAAAGLVSAALTPAVAQDSSKPAKGKEKCYGVAKAGENGCQSLSGAHTCGGCSMVNYSGENWKWVPMGTCLEMGGHYEPFEGLGKLATSTPIPK